jgi:Ser/Thr protein kinase RdoA (MazF antagonist)
MESFEQLTDRGQAKRLKSLVIRALDQYDMKVSDIQLVGLFTNAVFRLRTKSGRSYIMRVCQPGWRTKSDLISEIIWLQALSRDTDIRIPEPIPARNGEFFVETLVEGVPEVRRCVVLSWLPGALLATKLNEKNLYQMGVLFARLHEHGAVFVPPDGFTKRKMDSIYARDEPDVLFNEASQDAFMPETKVVLRQTDARVKEAFAQLYRVPQGLQVIHNDLHHENIKIYYGHLYPFDFEDTIWGYPVQDVAMGLQDLMVDVDRDEYEPYQNAFREGYESLRNWPEHYEGQIDTFRAGRMLWVANYVARYERKYLRAHIDWLARQFEIYLDTGIIHKP